MNDVPLREYLESLISDTEKHLKSLILEGDERLSGHIQAQFEQVRQQYAQVAMALTSADKLEVARLADLERMITLQLKARDQAIDKAEAASEKRFESVNEFRGQLQDQALRFLPREVYETQHADVLRALQANTKRLDELSGQQAGTRAAIGLMISIAIIVITAASFLANYLTGH